MFNPASLRIIRQGVDSTTFDGFVGIRMASDGKMEFCLPYGFREFALSEGQEVTQLFFKLYKALKYFQSMLQANLHKLSPHKDGLLRSDQGFSFASKDDTTIIMYSKIAALESILANYDELRIFSIESRNRRSSQINYSHIEKYLHQAVYLEDHIPYVDEMVMSQPVIQYTITDIVSMYCYVFTELKRQLDEEDNVPIEVINYARTFRELHLLSDSSLFSYTHDVTINLLRFVLDEIHRQVVLKDDDYWHFYSALENFLYGHPKPNSDGIYWGISTFSPIWEDMCLVYLHDKDWGGVWYADTTRFSNKQIGRYKVFLDPRYKSPFYFELNGKRRYLRPDLVRMPYFDADKWFEETFRVDWLNKTTCRITLKMSSRLSWFNNSLDPKLKTHGMRQKRAAATSHVYTSTSEQKVSQAVKEVKEFVQATRIRKPPSHLVADFKYVDVSSYTGDVLTDKIQYDIVKQLTYEYAIALNAPNNITETESQFCIPHYYAVKPDDIGDRVDNQLLHDDLTDAGIVVLKVDYSAVQEAYLSSYAKNNY